MVASFAWAPAFADCGDPDDTPRPDEDCDADGWTVVDGDCSDDDATTNPGENESCDAPADEDCNGLFDDGCDRLLQRGSLEGGSTCQTAPGASGGLLLALFSAQAWVRPRRAPWAAPERARRRAAFRIMAGAPRRAASACASVVRKWTRRC